MSMKDKKIVPFPGTEMENKKSEKGWIKRILALLVRHPLYTVLIGVIIPVIIGVIGPFLGKNIGTTELTESYIMPYTYAQENYIANAPRRQNINVSGAQDGEIKTEDFYNEACALRAVFSCSKISMSQVTDSLLNVYSLEPYTYANVNYFAFAKENEVRFYAVNSGDGASEPAELSFSAKLCPEMDLAEEIAFTWTDLDAELSESSEVQETLEIKSESLGAGDGIQIYSFLLSDLALEQIESGKSIALHLDVKEQEEETSLILGWLSMYDGKVIVGTGGGDGDTDKYTYYVYVDVENGGNRKIPVNAVFNIQDYAAADTVIIPSRSCKMEYSMSYQVGEKELETERFISTIRVPRYKALGAHEVAFHMNEKDLDKYSYGSDKELHEKVKFDPTSLMADK